MASRQRWWNLYGIERETRNAYVRRQKVNRAGEREMHRAQNGWCTKGIGRRYYCTAASKLRQYTYVYRRVCTLVATRGERAWGSQVFRWSSSSTVLICMLLYRRSGTVLPARTPPATRRLSIFVVSGGSLLYRATRNHLQLIAAVGLATVTRSVNQSVVCVAVLQYLLAFIMARGVIAAVANWVQFKICGYDRSDIGVANRSNR